MKKLSIVVPCYNEQETIYPFLEETQKVESKMKDQLIFDYIFVNDGSKDETLKVLRDVANRFANVHYLSFSRNFGKEAGLLAGLEAADGDFITVMDADLQDPPELLIDMYEKIKEGYDVVGTRRADRKGEPVIRSFFSKMFYKIINAVSDTEMVDGARDFRLMTRQVVDSILKLGEVNRFSKGIFSWVGFDVTYIAYENRERVAGETSWSFWSLFKYSIDGIVNFTNAPLQIASIFGLVFTFIAFLAIIFIMIRKFIWGDPVSGWPSLVCIIVFLSGVQMFCIGIIGQYLSKTYVEVKERPHYIISESNKEVEKVN